MRRSDDDLKDAAGYQVPRAIVHHHREQSRSYRGLGIYRVSVSRLTNAPGNNADAVARWL